MNSLLDTLAGTGAAASAVAPVSVPKQHAPAPACPVSVVPYNACFDPQADAFLPWVWKKMQDDDLVDYYFPGQKETGFATFARMFSGDAQVGLFKTEDESSQLWEDRVPGFITWTAMRMGASDVLVAGFIFFRRFQNHRTTDDAAKAAFTYWFNTTEAQIILGVCPSEHHAAIRYNKRIGLHEVGRIPLAHVFKNNPCDAILYALTRDEWKGRQ